MTPNLKRIEKHYQKSLEAAFKVLEALKILKVNNGKKSIIRVCVINTLSYNNVKNVG